MDRELALLHDLKSGKESAYKAFYIEYFNMVKNHILNNTGSEEDAKDIFQDAAIVIIEKLNDQDFELTCTVKTYVYSVARNLWYTKLRREKCQVPPKEYENYIRFGVSLEEKELQEEQMNIVEQCLASLKDPCKTILTQFYFFKTSMKEIASMLDYQNPDHAKAQKYKCLQRLKKMALNKS